MKLRTYWVMACVELFEELTFDASDEESDEDRAIGYYKNFGLTATSEAEACALVSARIADGEVCWESSEISSDVIDRLDDAILSRSTDWNERGIWYESGRVFFGCDENDGASEH